MPSPLRNTIATVVATVGFFVSTSSHAGNEIRPGEIWQDTGGAPIQAHGGGILPHGDVYYWYGEDRTPGLASVASCYSSANLLDWKRDGVALWGKDLPIVDGKPTFVERPKVLYNERTKPFVMWTHLEQRGHQFALAGIAVSDTPAGPFRFLKALRPVVDPKPFLTLDSEKDTASQREFGGTFRDMNLFLEDDGRAYAFYASEGNLTMVVVRLNDDFTGPETPQIENQTWARILVKKHREAPSPFKFQGKYHLITSACSGWAPNAADHATADRILGPWENTGNPCEGKEADETFVSQSTFVLPAPGRSDSFIFMADRWNPKNLQDSRYIWLPLEFNQDFRPVIRWQDRWSLPLNHE